MTSDFDQMMAYHLESLLIFGWRSRPSLHLTGGSPLQNQGFVKINFFVPAEYPHMFFQRLQ